ncbi:MAG TPA: ArsA-related P-loop ATPase [Polyangia bacterium]|nr:ArsA-related P-loop ATPase [Polyangia bacterium]
MTPLRDLRLVVVSGKGGVGRTTVAAALARAAADAGKRVLVAGSAPTDRLGRLFGRPALGPTVTALAPGIDGVNMTSESALLEYGVLTLRSELVARALFENRAARGFLGAIPGLDAYALLGKAWWHTTEQVNGRPRYDLVILDGPASGHAPLMLRIPGAILDAMPKGPLSRDARAIDELLHDPTRAALLVVTLAEELPANEARELVRATREGLRLPLGPLVVNAVAPDDADSPALAPLLDRTPGAVDPALAATLRLAGVARAHRRLAETAIAGLRRDPGLPILALPRLPTVDVGPAGIATLASHLAEPPQETPSPPRFSQETAG